MNSHNSATIAFSAECGGRDATAAVMPHFRALKSAAKGITLCDFPYPELAFILRVDGDIRQYGFSGTGNPEIDSEGKYIAIDIGVSMEDRNDIPSCIISAIVDSVPIVAAALNYQGIDWFNADTLKAPLEALCKQYSEACGSYISRG